MRRNRLNNFLAAAALMLPAGCAGVASGPAVGPVGPNIEAVAADAPAPYEGVRLDVIVPVFDPGIPEDPDDYEDAGVWPELRRAEANRFAIALQDELQHTGVFGDVHVTPTTAATGDLYVIGRILQSTGEDVEIEVTATDIGGTRWMTRRYEHRVKEHFWEDPRNEGKDPYRPVMQRAAQDVAEMVRERPDRDLTELRRIAELRFAETFSGESFSNYLRRDGQSYTLTALPDRDDPMLARTRAIRVQDGLFMNRMQRHYAGFVQHTDASYTAWQEHALLASKGRREAESSAFWQRAAGLGLATLGAAAVLGGVVAGGNTGKAVALGGVAAGLGGVYALSESFKSSAEGEVHADVLSELGESLNIEVTPQNIELEGTTAELTGDANEQFRQWRAFLRKIYAAERVPETKIPLR